MRIFLLLLMLCGFQVFAERLPSVTDLTGTLTTEEQSALNQQLQTLEQQNHLPGGRVGYADNRGQKH